MASSFELLEAYVKISERGATATINRIRQVEAAAVSASQRNVVIGISTSLDNALSQLNQVAAALNQVVGNARILSFSQTNNSLTQTVSLSQQVVNNTNNITNNIQRAGSASGGLNNVLSLLSQATLGYFSLQTAISAAGASFNESFGRERSFVTFRQLIGSAEEAKGLLEELENLARRTPFAFPELRQTAQRLLALGSSTENIADEILLIANVSAGTGAALEQISRVYTQVRSKQQLYAEELQQFGDAGVPILQELAKNLNTNEQGVRKLAEQGKIGFDEVERAFRTLTSEGGKFANLVTEIGNTTPALLTRLRDEATGLGADLADVTVDDLNVGLSTTVDILRLLRVDAQNTADTFTNLRAAIRLYEEATGSAFVRFDNVPATGFTRDIFAGTQSTQDTLDQTRRSIELIDEIAAKFTAAFKSIPSAAREVDSALSAAAASANARWRPLVSTIQDAEKALKADKAAADRLRESLLTPYEQLEQKLNEINRLQTRGLITPEIRTRAIKAANEEYRRLSETFNELSDSWQKVLDDFSSDPNVAAAERIRESLLTPYEQLEQKIREIGELQQKGVLGDDTSNRAIAKAIEDYDKLLRRQEKLAKNVERTSFTVGTDQEFKFRIEQSTEQRRAAQAAEEQARLQRTANGLLQDIRTELDELNNRPEVTEQTFDTSEIF